MLSESRVKYTLNLSYNSYMIFIVKGHDKIYIASETGRTTLVDTMAIVQGLDQPKPFKTCKFLYVHFCNRVLLILLDLCQKCQKPKILCWKAKILCWKAFSNAESSVNKAFRNLCYVPLEDRTKNALEQYICLLHQP